MTTIEGRLTCISVQTPQQETIVKAFIHILDNLFSVINMSMKVRFEVSFFVTTYLNFSTYVFAGRVVFLLI